LESADMVRKIETGHKWVYYELTPKSLEILKPKAPVQSIFLLAVGVVAVLVSGLSMIARDSYAAFGTMQEKMIAASSSQREVTGISVSINDVLTLLPGNRSIFNRTWSMEAPQIPFTLVCSAFPGNRASTKYATCDSRGLPLSA